MIKGPNEIHFQQQVENLTKQLDILQDRINNTSIERLHIHSESMNKIYTKIKGLNQIENKIEYDFKIKSGKSNYNQYDLKDKLRKYHFEKEKITDKYNGFLNQIENIKKEYLFKNSTKGDSPYGDIEMQNIKKMGQLTNRYENVNKDMQEIHGITGNINAELYNQGRVLKEMKDDARDAESELSMADQMMRILRNRSLITKLILIILIVFMGLADVLLLVVKLL